MANKRAVILRGQPEINEDGVASAAVKPGYLVAGYASIAHQSVAGANVPRAIALERDELGTGIDNTYQSATTLTAFYASGDTVKVAVGKPGDRFTMFLASGYGVAANGQLQSHTDGSLRPVEASQTPLFRLVQATVVGSAAVVAIAVEVM